MTQVAKATNYTIQIMKTLSLVEISSLTKEKIKVFKIATMILLMHLYHHFYQLMKFKLH